VYLGETMFDTLPVLSTILTLSFKAENPLHVKMLEE